jgi:outer membrane protein OmpA-like peptidoglycan-associated protein
MRFLSFRVFFTYCSGSGSPPVIAILAALIIAAGIFFLYTKPTLAPATNRVDTTAILQQPTPTQPAALPKPAVPQVKSPSTLGFARPQDLAAEFARSLQAGQYGQAAKMAGQNDDDLAEQKETATALEHMLQQLGYEVSTKDNIQMLGQSGSAIRMGIPLKKKGNSEASLQLQIEAERHQTTGWKIRQFYLPKELASAVPLESSQTLPVDANKPASMTAQPSGLFTVLSGPEALSSANDFVQSLLKQDFTKARQSIDESKVKPQKLAGLCIVFEEGKYQFKSNKPLVMTSTTPNNAWIIAQVESQTLQQQTEFGIEMQRSSPNAPWIICGLNLSDLLGSYAKSAVKLGVPYTPIVTNPKGGESLALYFEYDQSGLHPRAQKQLEIVASLLRSNTSRKLYISGHTDAHGSDTYNKNLSADRAKTVKDALCALGVSAEQVVTEGLGKSSPLSPNQKADGSDDPEGRSHNRRAEIYLDF